MEEWRDILGYEGQYQISNIGRVKSVERMVKSNANNMRIQYERFLSIHDNGHGYMSVSLWKDNKGTKLYVHRLVARAFCEGYEEGLHVDHINAIRNDNRASNLQWLTISQNNSKAFNKPIVQLTLNGEVVATWKSMAEAEKKGGFDSGNISRVCAGKRKKHGGFVWEYQ